MLDRTNHHLFQPLLYQVATGVLSEGDIAPPIRDVLRNQRNARVLLGEVVGIDLAGHDVVLDTIGERTSVRRRFVVLATVGATSRASRRLISRLIMPVVVMVSSKLG